MSDMFKKEEMDRMECMLSTFLKENGITLSVPVDIFELATALGFDVRGAIFPDSVEGLILVDEYSRRVGKFNSNKVIIYSIEMDIHAKKFIVAHELAHYIDEKQNDCHGKIVVAARDHKDDYSTNEFEQRMDYIAAAILMPKEDMLIRYAHSEVPKTKRFYMKLAEQYNVDLDLARRRVQEVFYGAE